DAEMFHRSVDLTRPLARTERILYKSKATGGTLRFAVAATDGHKTIAHGAATAMVVAGETEDADVSLDNGDFPDMGGGGPMVTPASPMSGTLRPIAFRAPEPVTWAVMESGGGTIDAAGNYFSPAAPGSYHVVATATADGTRTATATVTVVPLKLTPIA